MYTNKEIEIIVDNCRNMSELNRTCLIFKELIEEGYVKTAGYLRIKTLMRFRELQKL